MSNGPEQHPSSNESTATPDEARKICEGIEKARNLMRAAINLDDIAQRLTNKAIHETNEQYRDYEFRVDIPAGESARVVLDGEVRDEHPTEFVATDLQTLGRHGVEFYNWRTGESLTVRSLKFEVSPVILTTEGE